MLYGAKARWIWAEDYPWSPRLETYESIFAEMSEAWGRIDSLIFTFAPSLAGDPRHREWYRNMQRPGASPGTAIALSKMNREIDVRHVLPTIRVPALILHATDDRMVPVVHGRYIAEWIPGARYVELPGADQAASNAASPRPVRAAAMVLSVNRSVTIPLGTSAIGPSTRAM